MRRFSILKKESSIAKEIKIQAEHINRGLDDLVKKLKVRGWKWSIISGHKDT